MKYTALIIILAGILFSCSPKLAPDSNWGYQRWVLIELKEVPVQQSGVPGMLLSSFFPRKKDLQEMGGVTVSMEIMLLKKEVRSA